MSSAWLTDAIAVANTAIVDLGLTPGIQVGQVTHEAWIGADAYDKPTYDAPAQLDAVFQEGTRQVRTATGETITTQACVLLLGTVAPNGAAGRREPIDPRDRITLPSGYTGPIVENPGAPPTSVWLK